MPIVETKGPNGKIIDVSQVDLSQSGMLIMITDGHGGQVLINRLAWPNIVHATQMLLLQERERTEQATAKLIERERREGPAD